MFDASLRSIAWEGRIVVVGFASGEVPQIPANVLLVKNAAVLGFYWGSYRKHDPERLRAGFRELFEWHRAGPHPPHVSQTLPLEQTADAIRPAARAAQHRQGRGDRALASTLVRQPSRADDATAGCCLRPRRARGLIQPHARADARHRQQERLLLVAAALAAAASRPDSPFEELLIPLRQADTAARDPPHSPSGKVPVLLAGDLRIWDCLAIAEFLAERDPSLWPADPGARALARSISAEMHSGFAALRTFLPMDFTARFGPPGKLLTPVRGGHRAGSLAIWAECRRRMRRGRAVPVRRVHHRRRHVRTGLLALHDLRRTARPSRRRPMSRTMMGLPAMLEWARGAAAEAATPAIAAPASQPRRGRAGRPPSACPTPAPRRRRSRRRRAPEPPKRGRAEPELAVVRRAASRRRQPPEPEPRRRRQQPPPRVAPAPGRAARSCAMRRAPIPSTVMVKPIGDGTRRRR